MHPQTVKEIYQNVTQNITGRFAMSQDDAMTLANVLEAAGDGDYIEIGTLWGGSAIFAGLVREFLGVTGRIYAIDPLIGYYGGLDGILEITEQKIRGNFSGFGVNVELVKAFSVPFPLDDVSANVILIDGDHSLDVVAQDWKSAKAHSSRFVVFHDYDDEPIRDFVDHIKGWKKYAVSDRMAVMERP